MPRIRGAVRNPAMSPTGLGLEQHHPQTGIRAGPQQMDGGQRPARAATNDRDIRPDITTLAEFLGFDNAHRSTHAAHPPIL
jgi:hypothetical protein